MRLTKPLTTALVALLLPACELTDQGQDPAVDLTVGASVGTSTGALTEGQTASLLRLREEEKLARDVYRTLGDRYGATVFSNIAGSEQRHMDAVAGLLAVYGLTDPITDDAVGVFTAPELQALYASLVARGAASLGDALAVGAAIEELDLADLADALAEAPPADVVQVFDNLAKGSRNHLRAFVRQLDAGGFPYTPSSLDADEVEAILAAPQERGPVDGASGSHAGRGRGAGGGARSSDCTGTGPAL